MNGFDGYLQEVRGAMAGMEPSVREDILRELHSHLQDAVAANGGDVRRAMDELGPPLQVGREYRAIYGYGRAYQAIFVAVAAVLAAFTAPVLQGITSSSGITYYVPNLLSYPFLVLAILWLLWVSVQAGSRAGIYAGLGAFVARIAVALLLILAPSGGIVTWDGLTILVLSSALLVLLGWLPGTAKKAWSKTGAQL